LTPGTGPVWPVPATPATDFERQAMTAQPMKERELREKAQCMNCNELIGQKAVPIIWKIKTERHGLDLKAIKRQQGLGMLIGHGRIAMAMGPNENMTQVLAEHEIVICDQCALSGINLFALCEVAAEERQSREAADKG